MDVAQAQELAYKLLDQHGLLDLGWKFRWTEAVREFGHCWYREREIAMSRPLVALNESWHVEDTMLHEIAHALVGPGVDAHGWEWRRKAWEIGATPEPTYDASVVTPPALWSGWCSKCRGHVMDRNCLFYDSTRRWRSGCCGEEIWWRNRKNGKTVVYR